MKVHYYIHKSLLPLVPFTSQVSPAHTLTPCFHKISFNISPIYDQASHVVFSSDILNKICIFSFLSYVLHAPPTLFCFITKIYGEEHSHEAPHYVIISNPMGFTLSYVQIYYSLQNPVIMYPQSMFFPWNKYWSAEVTYLWCTFIISMTNLWKTSIYIDLSARVDYLCCVKVANLGHASSWVHCHLNKVIVTTKITLKLILLAYKKKLY